MTGTLAGALAARKIPTPLITRIKAHYPASQSVRRGIAIEWDGDVQEDG